MGARAARYLGDRWPADPQMSGDLALRPPLDEVHAVDFADPVGESISRFLSGAISDT